MKEEKKKKKPFIVRVLKFLIEMGVFILVVLALTYLVATFVAQRVGVSNISMEDTMTEGDILLLDKITYRIRDPKRYEIICFNSGFEREGLIKRIIALPGETVQITNGMIFIDGIQIDDVEGLDKIEDAGLAEQEIQLGDDEYFVVGDNREKSIDSRSADIGNVKREDILGRTSLRIYPFDRFGMLKKK